MELYNSMHERYGYIVDSVYDNFRHKFTKSTDCTKVRLSISYEGKEIREQIDFVAPDTIRLSLRNMVIALGSLGIKANELISIMNSNLHIHMYEDVEAQMRRQQAIDLRFRSQQMITAQENRRREDIAQNKFEKQQLYARSQHQMNLRYSGDSEPSEPKLKRYDPDQYEHLIGQYYVDKDGKLFHRELDRDYMVPMKWNDMSKSMYDYDSEEVVEEAPKLSWTDSIAVFKLAKLLAKRWRNMPRQHKDVVLGAAIFLITFCVLLYLS